MVSTNSCGVRPPSEPCGLTPLQPFLHASMIHRPFRSARDLGLVAIESRMPVPFASERGYNGICALSRCSRRGRPHDNRTV